MITLVEALNYRCLRYVSRPLSALHVLVGPNASGKTTFLDAIGLLSDIVTDGLDAALTDRAIDPRQLLFGGHGARLEFAVEAAVPAELRHQTIKPELGTVRYQVALGVDEPQNRFEFKAETLLLQEADAPSVVQRPLFPQSLAPPDSLQVSIKQARNKVLVNKVRGGNDNFYRETKRSDRGWAPSFRLGPDKSALGNLPADETSFPVATWFREYLGSGVEIFALNSREMRRPSPPTRVRGFLPDGTNISWAVDDLRRSNPDRHAAWVRHLRTALPDLVDIETVQRPEDRHCYMVYKYSGGLTVPSWLVSDGTLRLTALTLPAYLEGLRGVYLIEEPENGIHPGAVATVYDSLSSMYAAQVLLATHSPVFLNAAQTDQILCFAKDDDGATDIVLGSEHPRLREWRGEADLGTLLASGVLG